MEEGEQRLVAEVIGTLRGSGFLIAPGLILTALHVVLGDDATAPDTVPSGISADVRLFGDALAAIPPGSLGWNRARNQARLAAARIPWHKANLVWPRAGTPTEACDIALLALEDPAATSLAPLSSVRVATPRRRDEGCVAGGFPAFRLEGAPESGIWEYYPLEGTLCEAGIRRSDPARSLEVTSPGLPDQVNGWRGMSGAAVWLDGVTGCTDIVGVMHARVGELKSNDVLLYWPMAAIAADDPDFWKLTGLTPPGDAPAVTIAPAATAKPLVAQLGDNFFRFDRTALSDDFRQQVGDMLAAASRPLVVVLRGHRIDEPALCAQRFADILAYEAWPENAALYSAPLQLDCGVAQQLPARRVGSLLRQWAQHYSDQRLTLGSNVRAIIQAGLMDSGRARCMLIEHVDTEFAPGCREVFAGALAPLREWQPAEPGATPPVLLVSILTGSDLGPADTAYRPPVCFSGKAACVDAAVAALARETPELNWIVGIPDLGAEPARPPNVAEWLNEIGRVERSAALPAGLGAEIELQLRPHIQFPIVFVREAVDRVIVAQRS